MGTTQPVTPTGDVYVDSLLAGQRWTSALTWSLPQTVGDYGQNYPALDALDSGFGPLNASEQAAVAYMMGTLLPSLIAAPIAFLGNNGSGDIRFAHTANTTSAYAYYPGELGDAGGDVFVNDYRDNFSPLPGNYGWHTYLHEIGHALGLKHSFEASDPPPPFETIVMPLDRDGSEFTVMTYKSGIGEGNGYTNEPFGYPQSLMQYDILALQTLYGANYNAHAGDTTYKWDPNTGQEFIDGAAQPMPGANRVFLTVWDGNGDDTYDFSNYTTDLEVDLRPGGWSVLSDAQIADLGLGHDARGNVFNAFEVNDDPRSLIENVRGGSGDDTMIGNAANNVMTGGSGDDSFVFTPEAHDTSRDVIADFGNGNDHVVLAGVNVVKLGGNLALLSDGTLIDASGHTWSHADFVHHGHF